MPGVTGFECSHWKKVFPSPNPEAGKPMKVNAVSLENIPGQRLQWYYDVSKAIILFCILVL